MPAVSRITDDLTTGHVCTTITQIDTSNTNRSVTANDLDIIVIGAPTVSHTNPPSPACPPHVAELNAGSPSLFINGIAVGRITDSADAGAMIEGSQSVFAED